MTWEIVPVPPADGGDDGGDGAPGVALQFQDEGANLGDTSADTVNFVGAGVTATRAGATVTVTVNGGGGGGGGASDIVELTTDYVLTTDDDNVIFWSDTTVTVTVPEGLNPPPACAFLPPDAGSITLHVEGAALLDGGTADIIATLAAFPSGVTLTPRYGHDDEYVTNGGLPTFGSMPDDPRDNVTLAAYLDAKQDRVSGVASLKLVSDYTLTQGDNGRTLRMAATTTRTVTIPAGLSTDFHFYIAIMSVATAPVIVATDTGLPALITVGMGSARAQKKVSHPGAVVEVRCVGDQDQFMCVSSRYWEAAELPVQITGNYAFTNADDGVTAEVTGPYTLTIPAGLRWLEGVALEMPVSGVVTFAVTGGAKINEGTVPLTRTSSDVLLVALVPKGNAVDSYILTGG